MGAAPAQPILRYTLLLHDLGKPDTFSLDENGQGHFYGHWRVSAAKAEAILDRLRFDTHSKRTILNLVERHDCEMPLSQRMVLRRLRQLGEEQLRLLLDVKRADNLAQAPPSAPASSCWTSGSAAGSGAGGGTLLLPAQLAVKGKRLDCNWPVRSPGGENSKLPFGPGRGGAAAQ